jgi:hypothetical protein
MNNNRKCPERMRTILQAMERSIDAARRSRMKISPAEPLMPSPPPTARPITFGQTVAQELMRGPEQEAPRLKARPKRLDAPLMNPFQQPSYRPEAG